jgi:hypothetical protein
MIQRKRQFQAGDRNKGGDREPHMKAFFKARLETLIHASSTPASTTALSPNSKSWTSGTPPTIK